MVKSMSGDLSGSVKEAIVVRGHNANGKMKVMRQCALPLTGKGVVDVLTADPSVFKIDETCVTLTELASDVTVAVIAEGPTPTSESARRHRAGDAKCRKHG
jgi:3-oxoacid CoA-transferase subunit B